MMDHDVFISHSVVDKDIAEAIQATLEPKNVQCWIAPRDIPAGEIWTSTIYDAIDNCILFVLVYSANANESQDVLSELQIAYNKGKPIILFRVDETPLSKEVEFCTSRYQWMDASKPTLEEHLKQLTETVQRYLDRDKAVNVRDAAEANVKEKAQLEEEKEISPKITPIYTPPIPTSIPTVEPSATMITANITQAKIKNKLEKPQYGGTFTIRAVSLDNINIDPANHVKERYQYWYESLFKPDWKLDRDIWPFTTNFTPVEYFQGLLAESWEQTDPTTITVYLRKGVKWHDKPPVNGREFTAYDVQYNYDRILFSNSGFTQPMPIMTEQLSNIVRAIAKDKYTVVFLFKEPSILNIYQVLNSINIAAPEILKDDELLNNLSFAVGTGPWVLTDFVRSSSMTFTQNYNYWGYDERYPQNKLPYMDTVKVIAIPDISTALAALRTGKIDILANTTWQQAKSIANTNPEILQAQWPAAGPSLELRCDRIPFNDIRVRKALQMAIDRKTIAQTHYGGTVDGTPTGLMSPQYKGWIIPYDKWPQELQEEYGYNPAEARKLLAEAGYPNGFITNCVAPSNSDLELLQIIGSYFHDIGVDLEIKVMELGTFMSYIVAGKQEQMIFSNKTGSTLSPFTSLCLRQSGNRKNYTFSNDASYDNLISEIENATSIEGIKQIIAAADIYAIRQHWAINVCSVATPVLWQPYLKEYSGELDPGAFDFARWWIDYELKKSMGR